MALLVVVPRIPHGAGAATNAVMVVGEFSNMRFTAEHAYGYSVQLWRQGDQLFGLLLASDGLQGDTPTGLLEEIKFDTHTGVLSFVAKLTTGVTLLGSSPPFKEVPVCERFEFRGNLGPGMLTGRMNRDRLQPTKEHGDRPAAQSGHPSHDPARDLWRVEEVGRRYSEVAGSPVLSRARGDYRPIRSCPSGLVNGQSEDCLEL